jgi:hypothetical protein
MTGDLAGPDQRAAQQAYEAAARLYEQAAPELDRAAAHCRVAAPISEGPRCRGSGARLGGAGSSPRAELQLEEQARTHRLKAAPLGPVSKITSGR